MTDKTVVRGTVQRADGTAAVERVRFDPLDVLADGVTIAPVPVFAPVDSRGGFSVALYPGRYRFTAGVVGREVTVPIAGPVDLRELIGG